MTGVFVNRYVLLVEDDGDIAEIVQTYLENDGLRVTCVASGEAAVELVADMDSPPDAVILDVNLPGINGFEVLARIRPRITGPILLLTARSDDMDAIYGLGAGADEYVTKPFSPRVLVARIRALMRREFTQPNGAATDGVESANGRIKLGHVTVDTLAQIVWRKDEVVRLAPREYELLVYLVGKAGSPTSPEQIYRDVWGNRYGDLASVAVHVQRLRRKIEEQPGKPRLIRTRHGYGYYVDRSSEDSTE